VLLLVKADMRRRLEQGFAILFLLVCAPILVVFTILLWTAQRRPIFERVWLRGAGCEVWQFRTKTQSAVTRWMRNWLIDRWPAMWDVARGSVDLHLLRVIFLNPHR
jgi:lipopolysaccharide/colanic/teichoic acid biosynthesis glycosyltransferase